ncbi:MAG: sigma-70 family RNA polymerase sigma factor [Candidatus Krumholzibacteriota bacterium]|nr:sigma-70 family RNA polymerase sigma factor [Candidatus Krumholzibacteriota bacterium]
MFPQDRAGKTGGIPAGARKSSGSGSPEYKSVLSDDVTDMIVQGFIEGHPEHVRRVESWARYVAEHHVWGFETAEDIVQATLLAVVQNLRDGCFKGGDLRAYVRRVAKNMCITSYRRLKSRGDHVSFDSVSDPVSKQDDGERIESRVMLERMLDRLNQVCREMILRAYVEGFSRKEIGDWLGISEEAARVRLFRCVENARELLRGPLMNGDL